MKRVSLRAHAGRALIAGAVLLPAALIVIAILYKGALGVRFMTAGSGALTRWVVADAALLGLGFWLHRGEDL